jgi:glycosyltransferase involved in cell wall biosynthesis
MKIGFIDARLGATDGVSLETAKWASVLERLGHKIHYIVGEYETPPRDTIIIEQMGFFTPENIWIQKNAFGPTDNKNELYKVINSQAAKIEEDIARAIDALKLDLLILENCITIPMQIPLGLALKNLLHKNPIPVIAHHHDFYWERERFLKNNVQDILDIAFPVIEDCISHTVINSIQQKELLKKFDINSVVVPNVFDFKADCNKVDDYNRDFKEILGLSPHDVVFLQPSRIVPRKSIELSVELVHRMRDPKIKLLLAGYSGDEGQLYLSELEELIARKSVPAYFAHSHIASTRREKPVKKYTLWDSYVHSDLVTFPSSFEGFGNHAVEAFYFKKPLFINNYSVFEYDIAPTGVDVILIDGEITTETIEKTQHVLSNSAYREQMVNQNFEIAQQHFSFETLEKLLIDIIKLHPMGLGFKR